jgi:hypothetical protein
MIARKATPRRLPWLRVQLVMDGWPATPFRPFLIACVASSFRMAWRGVAPEKKNMRRRDHRSYSFRVRKLLFLTLVSDGAKFLGVAS